MSLIDALEVGDKFKVNGIMRGFRDNKGMIDYGCVFSVPSADRIPGLIQNGGYERVARLIGAAIHTAMESLNLSKPLTPSQTADLADAIIDSASQDYISIEDVVLFLQKIVRGEVGLLYSSMDVAKFMTAFEIYRMERHRTYFNMKNERDAQFKIMGKEDRRPSEGDRADIDPQTFINLANSMYSDDTK